MYDPPEAPSAESLQLDFSRIPPEALDDHHRVAIELPCRQCGYNLQTLEAVGSCPECGTAVSWSLIDDLLRFADADWLDTLGRGMLWVLFSILAGFAVGVGWVIFFGVIGPGIASEAGLTALMTLITLSAGLGYWRLTTPEPLADPSIVPPTQVRRWARGLLMSSIVLTLGSLLLDAVAVSFINTTFNRTIQIVEATNQAVTILADIVGTVGLVCLAIVLRRLALRVPHPSIARQTLVIAWVWVGLSALGYAVAATIFIIEKLNPNTFNTWGTNDLASVMGILGCGTGLVVLVFAIWTLVLMIRYHLLFKRHAGYARLPLPQQPIRPLHD